VLSVGTDNCSDHKSLIVVAFIDQISIVNANIHTIYNRKAEWIQ
jgi:hypothetical protein